MDVSPSVATGAAGAGLSSGGGLRRLEELQFDNQSLRSLPVDPDRRNTQRQVRGACFSLVEPTPVANPQLVVASLDALSLLDMHPDEVNRDDFAAFFSGNQLLPGAQPAAHCYCGHQFGSFAGQLGDGATMYLGEVVNGRGQRWEVQFKGAGRTPYSRTADGRKVLRSSLREFLCSEAMHFLGVPTTRAGTIVSSDTRIARDPYYDGNVLHERAAIITRIAPSFIRFGSFEISKKTDRFTGRAGPNASAPDRGLGILRRLADHVCQHLYPDVTVPLAEHDAASGTQRFGAAAYTAMFREVAKRTARLAAAWQSVGFCHGVLNTDNMSMLGLTIDYGPFGFMDRYDPGFVCNASDDGARYSYENQPAMCRWNCERLAEALAPLLHEEEEARGARELVQWLGEDFDQEFQREYHERMMRKLGLLRAREDGDAAFVRRLLETMHLTGADFTNTFRALMAVPVPLVDPGPEAEGREEEAEDDGADLDAALRLVLEQCCPIEVLREAIAPRIPQHQLQMLVRLAAQDPSILAQLGVAPGMLESELERLRKARELHGVSAEQKRAQDRRLWCKLLRTYRARLWRELQAAAVADGSEAALATSAEAVAAADVSPGTRRAVALDRLRAMQRANPKYVLRNHVAQECIDRVEKGEFIAARQLLARLADPYALTESLPVPEQGSAAGGLAVAAAAGDKKQAEKELVAATAAAEAVHPRQSLAPAMAMNLPADRCAEVAEAEGAPFSSAPSKSLVCDTLPPAWSLKLRVT